MTDKEIKEIKKALECCDDFGWCGQCPLQGVIDCKTVLTDNVLDLINRQQEENKNLKGHLEQLKSRYDNAKAEIERLERHTEMYHELRAETIKEFAKKIDDEIYEALTNNENVIREREFKYNVNRFDDIFCSSCMGENIALCGIHDFITALVKEMVGEQK